MADAGNSRLFGKKAIERISSPEELSDYLHVTNPGIWGMFLALVLVLVGFVSWATVGKLESVINVKASVKDGSAVMTVRDSESEIVAGMRLRIGNEEYYVSSVNVDDEGNTIVYAPVKLLNGIYDTVIVIESISPIKFLFNL